MHKTASWLLVAIWMTTLFILGIVVEQVMKCVVMRYAGGCPTCGNDANYLAMFPKVWADIKSRFIGKK